MFRPLLVLGALLLVAVAPVEAQRRADEARSNRDRDRDRDRREQFRDFADLVVERIREDRDDIRVKVKNIGDAASPASRLAVIVVTEQGRRFLLAEVPPLRPGQDRNIRVETSFRPDRRGTKITAVADFFDNIRERNERNNTLERFVD